MNHAPSINANIGTQQVIRTCQVEENQRMLAVQIDTLMQSLDSLENRLSPVLTPRAPSDPSTKPIPEEMLVPIAADYRDRYKHILNLTNVVQGMLQRLELP